jgi:hypothetical protein
LAGYRIHYGTESGHYTKTIDVGNVTQTTITGLAAGTTYFASGTAYNTFDLESAYSNEVQFTTSTPSADADSDRDGLSDLFEITYGAGQDLNPFSDLDDDGLTALVEFVHGLDPTQSTSADFASAELVESDETSYFALCFYVDPLALQFVDIHVERSADLLSWRSDQTTRLSSGSTSAVEDPAELVKIVKRSTIPFEGQTREFLRIRYEVTSP